MKQEVKSEDRKKFEKLGQIYSVLFIIAVITPIPLTYFLSYFGIAIWAAIMAVTLYVAIMVEKKKKQFDIQTYREIIAFTEGEGLDEIAKAREEGKRIYQKILLAFAAGIITLVIAIVFAKLLG